MRRFYLWSCLAIVVVLVSACANTTSIPRLPERLGVEEGMVVARVSMPGVNIWGNAQVTIDGVTTSANLRDGYIAMTLPAGEHEIRDMRVSGWNVTKNELDVSPYRLVKGGGGHYTPIYTYIPSSPVYYTSLPIKRKFTVESGKITSLGMMVFILDPKDAAKKKFFTVNLDNREVMQYFLQANYRQLVDSMKDRSLNLAPATYLPSEKLSVLRDAIVVQEMSRGGKTLPAGEGKLLVYGDAGTVAIVHDINQPQPRIELLDMGTLANIVDAQRDGDRWLFLASVGKFGVYENGKLKVSDLPGAYQPEMLRRLKSGNYMVVDNRMRMLLSADKGASWVVNEKALQADASNEYGYIETSQGFYLHSPIKGVPTAIIFGDGSARDITPIKPPSTIGLIGRRTNSKLVARAEDLFLLYDSQDFHVRLSGKGEWLLRSKPEVTCGGLEFAETGITIKTKCGETVFESQDNGQTWKRPTV